MRTGFLDAAAPWAYVRSVQPFNESSPGGDSKSKSAWLVNVLIKLCRAIADNCEEIVKAAPRVGPVGPIAPPPGPTGGAGAPLGPLVPRTRRGKEAALNGNEKCYFPSGSGEIVSGKNGKH